MRKAPWGIGGYTALAIMGQLGAAQATDVQHRFFDYSETPEAFRPLGFDWLGLNWKPGFRNDLSFDSNTFPQRTGGAETSVLDEPTAEIAALRQTDRWKIQTQLQAGHRANFSNSDESATLFDTNLDVAYNPWGGGTLYLTAGYLNQMIDRADPDDLNGGEPIVRYAAPVTAGWRQQGRRMGLDLGWSYTHFDHESPKPRAGGANLNAATMNRDEMGFNGEVRAKATPHQWVFLSGRYTKFDYEGGSMLAGRRARDVPPDETVTRSGDGYQVMFGDRLGTAPGLNGVLAVGYLERNFDSTRRRDIATFGLDARISAPLNEKLRLKAGITKAIEETRVPNASGYVATNYDVGLRYDWQTNWAFFGGIGLTSRDFQGLAREDQLGRAEIGATYYWNRWLHVTGTVRHSVQNSDGGPDFDRTIGLIRLQTQM